MRPKSAIDPAHLFAFELILGVFLFYFVYLQLRRLKYWRIARQLGADYESQGFFNSGKLAGSVEGGRYTIYTRERAGYRNTTTWTTFSLECPYQGIPVSLQGRFFKTFPDWKFALTRGDKKIGSASGLQLALQEVPVPLAEKYHAQVLSLFQDIALADSGLLSKRRISIDLERDSLSFSMPGALSNAGRASQVIAMLSKVAIRLRSSPLSQAQGAPS